MHFKNNYFILNSSVYCNPEYHLGETCLHSVCKHHCSFLLGSLRTLMVYLLDHFFRFRDLISFTLIKLFKRNGSRIFDHIPTGIPPLHVPYFLNRDLDPPGNPPRWSMFSNNSQTRIVPFLTRFADDPIGKEAERETTIGDTKNVNKHINKHGCLTGRILPRTKQCKTTNIL